MSKSIRLWNVLIGGICALFSITSQATAAEIGQVEFWIVVRN